LIRRDYLELFAYWSSGLGYYSGGSGGWVILSNFRGTRIRAGARSFGSNLEGGGPIGRYASFT
jgi:hypothetical protein